MQGEITLVVEGVRDTGMNAGKALNRAAIERELHILTSTGISSSAAVKMVAAKLNLPKNKVYDIATDLKNSDISSTEQGVAIKTE